MVRAARGVSSTTLLAAARLFITSRTCGLPGASNPLYLDMLAHMLSEMPLQQVPAYGRAPFAFAFASAFASALALLVAAVCDMRHCDCSCDWSSAQALVALATDARESDTTVVFPRCLNGPHGMYGPLICPVFGAAKAQNVGVKVLLCCCLAHRCQTLLKRLESMHGPLLIQCITLSLCRMGGSTEAQVYQRSSASHVSPSVFVVACDVALSDILRAQTHDRVKNVFLPRCLRLPTLAQMSDILKALRQLTTSRDSCGQGGTASATGWPLCHVQRLVIHDAFKNDVITLYARGSWCPSQVTPLVPRNNVQHRKVWC